MSHREIETKKINYLALIWLVLFSIHSVYGEDQNAPVNGDSANNVEHDSIEAVLSDSTDDMEGDSIEAVNNDSINNLLLLKYEKRLAEIEQQRVADSIKKRNSKNS